jgi:hypothetical protein
MTVSENQFLIQRQALNLRLRRSDMSCLNFGILLFKDITTGLMYN